LRDVVSKEQQSVFDRGNKIGLLAQKLFPGGIDCSPANPRLYQKSIQKTKQLINNENVVVLYEAAFVGLKALVYADIVVKDSDGYSIYEVKSSLKLSKTYYNDAAFQYAVIKDAGINIKSFYLINLNADYVLSDQLNINELFKITDVTEFVKAEEETVKKNIEEFIQILQLNKAPQVVIGTHCNSPYPCDFKGLCWKYIPKNSVYYFSNITPIIEVSWKEKGIQTINEITDYTLLNELLKTQIISYQKNEEIINKPSLNKFLSQIKYPLLFLDIETIMPALPQYKGTSPFHLLPILFSTITINKPDDSPLFYSWLHEYATDPRNEFMEQLSAQIQNIQTIAVFDKNSESNILNRLATDLPPYKQTIEQIKQKMIDIAEPFNKLWYYHPQFMGSLSLKNICSILLANNPFSGLPINNGQLAMIEYDKMLQTNDLFVRYEIGQQLKEYSKADVAALYQIVSFLQNKAQ
jgi:predicted RecB family nuclease